MKLKPITLLVYLDKSFCASKVKVHTCGRELSEEDKKRADKMNLPIAYGYFCKDTGQCGTMLEQIEKPKFTPPDSTNN